MILGDGLWYWCAFSELLMVSSLSQYTFGILNTLKRQQFHYDVQCIKPVDAGVSMTEATLTVLSSESYLLLCSLSQEEFC